MKTRHMPNWRTVQVAPVRGWFNVYSDLADDGGPEAAPMPAWLLQELVSYTIARYDDNGQYMGSRDEPEMPPYRTRVVASGAGQYEAHELTALDVDGSVSSNYEGTVHESELPRLLTHLASQENNR